ncbi:MAG: sialate O-acetylesterase [Caldicoprobacter sp.]|uniref:sialate O-acetylesterase n=1 Tax=Caldicoprobacter sp. TaxID=2004500 RepID=UPI0039C1278C
MALRLPRLISDGMVLQRDKDIKIWGWALPGETVTVSFMGQTYSSTADAKGKWEVLLPKLPAGGPHSMEITASQQRIIVKDILIGDVWVCSGQSNMVIPMERVKDIYEDEIAHCDNPLIRQFTVPDRYDFNGPREDLDGGIWEPLNADTVLRFSAVGYFFAKALFAKYGIPIGLIKACVGGTPIEAWMSEEVVRQFPGNMEIVEQLRVDGYIDTIKQMEEAKVRAWYESIDENDKGIQKDHVPWFAPEYDASDWARVKLPASWKEMGLDSIKGAVWFRKEIDVPAFMAGKPAKLYMGTIVDSDRTYVNGVLVGSTSYRYPPRKYEVPAGLLKAGKNVITVRVISNDGNGEFVKGKIYKLFGHGYEINLEGEWQYRVGAAIDEPLPTVTFFQYKPTGLFNGMIAPLLNYGIKGVIWYQGESNTDDPKGYCEKFCAMIADWRKKWGQGDFPFLYVQLANFMEAKDQPSESQWAQLREEQRRALCLPNTGMAVAIDLGEWNDLHPLNKKDVGERLALLARKLAYGEKDLVASGPLYKSMRVEGNKAIIEFSNIGSGLMVKGGGQLKHFAIAGRDKKFVWAKAIIEDDRVVVWHDDIPNPVAVRYAWADNPEGANLYNREGLPASPFTTEE